MNDTNPEGLLVQHNSSQYREIREFERFTLIRITYTTEDQGLMHNVGVPVHTRFVIWGKIRTMKRFEIDRIAGVFDDGSLILEFNMPLRSAVPRIGDMIELHGVQSRQPRMRYLVKQILRDLSITIGKALISPIGHEGAPAET